MSVRPARGAHFRRQRADAVRAAGHDRPGAPLPRAVARAKAEASGAWPSLT